MRRKNIFLAVLLSAAMASSSVTPAFAESLTDGETAVMETAEETETEPMEENGELENAADELLEAPENMAEDSRSTEDGEYAKEVIAQASNSSANMMGNISAIPYGVRKEETIYYTCLLYTSLAMGFQKDYQYVITGIIVILAVYADVRSKKRKN